MTIKKYTNQLLDTDSDDKSIGRDSYVNNENFRFNSVYSGGKGRFMSLKGFDLLANPYLPTTGINIRVASHFHSQFGYIFIFNYNSLGSNGIYMYDTTGSVFYKVLLDSQVTGGLLFDKDNLPH